MFQTLIAAERAALEGRNQGPDTQQCEEFMDEVLVRVKVAFVSAGILLGCRLR